MPRDGLLFSFRRGASTSGAECECHLPGTLAGLAVCDGQSGQCLCKPNVGQRQCDECVDGTFMLLEENLLGCQDCQCDVGGAVGPTCDRRGGQCPCRPRITGRRCSEPLQAHYFPNLHQHQYEVEDGHTPSGINARFDFDEQLFPNFSWRGYAIFSNIQKEILMDLHIQKPGLYQVIARYVSLNGDSIYSNISFTPDTYGETKQSEILTLPPSREPRFQAVVGPDGVTALPFVLNPGRWTLSIRAERPIFMVRTRNTFFLLTCRRADHFRVALCAKVDMSYASLGECLSCTGLCHFKHLSDTRVHLLLNHHLLNVAP